MDFENIPPLSALSEYALKPEEKPFDPTAFLVTPREEKNAANKLELEQKKIAEDKAYKLELSEKPHEPNKFLTIFCNNAKLAKESVPAQKSYNDYVAIYTDLVIAWKKAHPEAAARFDREAMQKDEEKKLKAATKTKKRTAATGPVSSYGELIKKLMMDVDTIKVDLRELEKFQSSELGKVELVTSNGHGEEESS